VYRPSYRVPLITGALGLLLTGCAVPVAVSIASYSFSGFSLATTGKGVGDMALSQATDKDCATWRIIKGDDICRDYTAEERHEMRLAHAEADNYPAGSHRSNEPDYVAMVPLRSHAEVVAEVERAEAAERALARAGVPQKQEKQVAARRPTVLASAESLPTVAPAAPVTVAPLKPVAQHQASVPAPLPPAAKPTAPGKASVLLAAVRPVPSPKPVTALLHPPLGGDARAEHAYLVLGSYSSRAAAESGLAHYAVARPLLSVATVGGKAVYRVVSGPFGAEELAKTRASLAKSYDIRGSWAIPSCGAGGGAACAVAKPVDPQLAALFKRS